MNKIKLIRSLMTIAFGLFLPFATTSIFAQQVISYQGLVTNNGTALQGAHNLALAIYSDSTATTAIYTESQFNVSFINGFFNIEIGSNPANPLPIFDAGSYDGTTRPAPSYFLGVAIDGGAELTPRSKLGTTPTAWSSRFADSARVSGGGGRVTLPITGLEIDGIAGLGLSQDASGLLDINVDNVTLGITSVPNGNNLEVLSSGIGSAQLANGSVTSAKIASEAVTSDLVGSGSATNGQVLTANGSGGAAWATSTSFSLPYAQTVSSASTLFSLTNSSTTSSNPVIHSQNASTVSSAVAIQGEITALSPGGFSAGVLGMNDGTGGTGIGVYGSHAGGGWGVYGTTVSGIGVYGYASGTSIGSTGVYGYSLPGYGVQGYSSTGTGVLAVASSTGNALVAEFSGSGTSTTTSNNIAIFETPAGNKARIDNTGKGFFDGGTQNSGADVAEEFDVAGERNSYEPGDVLVISATGTRKVEKCSKPYSRLVAGVYATKPGVTLTNMKIDADLSLEVPVGVIGVIPTKVSAENGPISIGDFLVTSSTPGHAMKADLSKLQIGEAIGKALANFNGPGTGVIEVLVGKY